MTTPASAEPTEVDREVARQWVADWFTDPALDEEPTSGLLARALASQRAEIVARYEELAAELQADARERINEGEQGLADSGYALFMAGARIREAAPK